ncbi:efflux RND transporter periplasmic adaptor subunit, partial [Cognatilysobacter segetis]|uniref:efflux RND transporter periplasmic adaptor subunit n=1 Tax=Cognatilysobacter segetis TaxID=2492394 RepID=UPI001060D4BC
ARGPACRVALVPRGDVDALRTEADVARADAVAAAARVSAARAQARAARSVLDVQGAADAASVRIAVEAPVDGRIVRRVAESETVVTAGQPLLELGDLRDLEVVVDALTSDAVRIAPGTPVELRNWGGDGVLAARVWRVEPGAFVKVSALGVEEQRVPVVVRLLHPPPAALGDGYRVDARFLVWRRSNVLSLPVAALFRDGDRWAIYAIEDGRARLRRVHVGRVGETRAEVLSGLREGGAVVLYPGDRLRDGSRVTLAATAEDG